MCCILCTNTKNPHAFAVLLVAVQSWYKIRRVAWELSVISPSAEQLETTRVKPNLSVLAHRAKHLSTHCRIAERVLRRIHHSRSDHVPWL